MGGKCTGGVGDGGGGGGGVGIEDGVGLGGGGGSNATGRAGVGRARMVFLAVARFGAAFFFTAPARLVATFLVATFLVERRGVAFLVGARFAGFFSAFVPRPRFTAFFFAAMASLLAA
jgi:hypothetical protein